MVGCLHPFMACYFVSEARAAVPTCLYKSFCVERRPTSGDHYLAKGLSSVFTCFAYGARGGARVLSVWEAPAPVTGDAEDLSRLQIAECSLTINNGFCKCPLMPDRRLSHSNLRVSSRTTTVRITALYHREKPG